MQNKFLFLFISLTLILSGCDKKEEVDILNKIETKKEVKTQLVAESRKLKENLEYPGIVIPEEEAQVIAKAGGTAQDVKFNLGDKVYLGDLLIKIDDADKNSSSQKSNFNSSQIAQAKLGVEQASSNLTMAQNNYQNLILSSEKDLSQAEINKKQAEKSKININSITSESYKSAELAYESAKTATEQAKLNLENRKKISAQSSADILTNSEIIATTVADTCDSIITGINNIIALDSSSYPSLAYKNNLGAMDSSSFSKAKNSYELAKDSNKQFKESKFEDLFAKINLATQLAQKTKDLTDKTKILLLNTTTSSELPQTSSLGTSLSSLQSINNGYQSQVSTAITQINGAKQALDNLEINNNSTLDSLEKIYELAKKQEDSAEQNLKNLQAGNTNQNDQVKFGADSANNQYENLKIKLNSQLSVARSQVDMAQIQYQNALASLNGLYDNHLIIAPLSGIITKKILRTEQPFLPVKQSQ